MAQAIARGIDVEVIYISHYMGESQGIYVRPSNGNYEGIKDPFDLKGRTIGVPFGSTMHYQVLFLLDMFGLTGLVHLLDLSPSQIVKAWDNEDIDAGACWGFAREHMLEGGRTLLTARVLANWGRPTFVVVAAQKQFARKHSEFVTHFVAVLARVNDSFMDRLGILDSENSLRWEAKIEPGESTSFLPSLVDALMIPTEVFQNPSHQTLYQKLQVLDLFQQLPADTQSSCAYLGSGDGSCDVASMLPLKTLEDTAKFLMDQKVIAAMGTVDNDVWGSGSFNGYYLSAAHRECADCYRVGSYDETTSGDMLLSELDRLNAEYGKSIFATEEVGRSLNDSTCEFGTVISGSVLSMGGLIGDGANGTRQHLCTF